MSRLNRDFWRQVEKHTTGRVNARTELDRRSIGFLLNSSWSQYLVVSIGLVFIFVSWWLPVCLPIGLLLAAWSFSSIWYYRADKVAEAIRE